MFEAVATIKKQTDAKVSVDPSVLSKLKTTKVKKIDLSNLSAENALRVLTAANGFGFIRKSVSDYIITSKELAVEWTEKHNLPIEAK